jgi:hypothetical protein
MLGIRESSRTILNLLTCHDNGHILIVSYSRDWIKQCEYSTHWIAYTILVVSVAFAKRQRYIPGNLPCVAITTSSVTAARATRHSSFCKSEQQLHTYILCYIRFLLIHAKMRNLASVPFLFCLCVLECVYLTILEVLWKIQNS